MPGPDAQFWQQRFEQQATPWDRGAPSPQLLAWLDAGLLVPQHDGSDPDDDESPRTRVLVPGCGSGHEVALLAARGFDVTGVDYAAAAIERTRARLQALLGSPASSRVNRAELVQADLLQYEPDGTFDAIYEQTCLCALHPDHWQPYAARLTRWLRPGGRMFALFVQARRDGTAPGVIDGPPYHVDVNAARALFAQPPWSWPRPPYVVQVHPAGFSELAIVLQRR